MFEDEDVQPGGLVPEPGGGSDSGGDIESEPGFGERDEAGDEYGGGAKFGDSGGDIEGGPGGGGSGDSGGDIEGGGGSGDSGGDIESDPDN